MAERGRAYHVGRIGEVAGGMTQVLNAYTSWQFEQFSIEVIRSRDGGGRISSLRLFLSAVHRLLTLQRRPDRDVVVVHLSQGGSFIREGALLLLAKARGLATVAQLHGSTFVSFAHRRPTTVRGVLRRADVVHALSEATAETVAQVVGPVEVVTIPNAVDHGAGGPKSRTIVFGGAVTRRKGVDVLLQAWASISDHRGWTLLLVGPAIEPDLLQEIPDGVAVLGALPHAELMRRLDCSKIAVLPSTDEAMPMFVLEALARRNCVVSTPIGAIPTVIGGGRGVLVPVGDARALAQALTTLMDDDELRQRITDSGYLHFSRTYSPTAVVPLLEEAWNRAIQRRGTGRRRPFSRNVDTKDVYSPDEAVA